MAGHPEESLTQAERTMALSPMDPGAFMFLAIAALANLGSGRAKKALELATRSKPPLRVAQRATRFMDYTDFTTCPLTGLTCSLISLPPARWTSITQTWSSNLIRSTSLYP